MHYSYVSLQCNSFIDHSDFADTASGCVKCKALQLLTGCVQRLYHTDAARIGAAPDFAPEKHRASAPVVLHAWPPGLEASTQVHVQSECF